MSISLRETCCSSAIDSEAS